ncbi:MAG: hypothetical protein GY782_05480 [Gammaproteobacteria bacterium]|nr:hypothetical protein [Gammaproteobacteria bacterium]
MRKLYDFTLILSGVDETTNQLEDTLYEVGCDDALINFRNGTVYLDFSREATTFEKAILSAIKEVESVNAIQVASVAPDDYVTESEIAKRLNVKRQAVSLWARGEREIAKTFPRPVMKVMEKSPLWQWHEVVKWLYEQNKISDAVLVHQAEFIANLNRVLQMREESIRKSQGKIMRQLAA